MDYLYIDDVDALRRKLTDDSRPLAGYWDEFLRMTERTDEFPRYAALAYLVTGERRYAEMYREQFLPPALDLWEKPFDVHFHSSWGESANFARWVAGYDWVVDSGVFSESEREEVARHLTDLAYGAPHFVSQGRYPASNNQIMAMSLGRAAIGYVFGVKRGNSRLARREMEGGLERLGEIVGHTPAGGYTLEGSTYHHQTCIPLTILFAELAEQITGQSVLGTAFPPNGTRLLDLIACDFYITGPGGMLPPWDNYAYTPRLNGGALSYLARKTGDMRPLRAYRDLEVWQRYDKMAWGRDDRLWTLVFWPEEVSPNCGGGRGVAGGNARAGCPCSHDVRHGQNGSKRPSRFDRATRDWEEWSRPWALEDMGAGLDHQATRTRLFQMWDECGGREHVVRPQVNPNSILFEAWGTPFLLDGKPTEECTEFDYSFSDVEDLFSDADVERIYQYRRRRADFTGRGEEEVLDEFVGSFSWGALGASNSIILDGDRAYVPPEPRVGELVEFGSTPALSAVSAECAGFYRPKYEVERMRRTSVLVDGRWGLTVDEIGLAEPTGCEWQVFTRSEAGADGRKTVVDTPEGNRLTIVPAEGGAHGPDIHAVPGMPQWPEGRSACVRYEREGKEVRFGFVLWPQRGLETVRELDSGWSLIRCATGEVLSEDCRPGELFDLAAGCAGGEEFVLEREFGEEEPEPGMKLWVEEVGRCVEIAINGKSVEFSEQGVYEDSWRPHLLPVVAEIGRHLREGENELSIRLESLGGQMARGPIRLCRPVAFGSVPMLERVAENLWRVEGAEGTWTVVVNPERDLIEAGGVRTDAFVALADGSALSLLKATRYGDEAWEFEASESASVVLRQGECCYGSSGSAGCEVTARGPMGPIEVDTGGTYDRFEFEPPDSVETEEMRREAVDLPAEGPEFAGQPAEHERLLIEAEEKGTDAVPELLAGLASRDWRVQAMSAELLGRIGDARAVEPLIDLVRSERPEEIYGAAGKWPDRSIPPRGARGFRVKQAAVRALGEICDPRAFDVLREVLEEGEDYYTVHAMAAWALGELGDARAVPVLREWIGPGEINVHLFASEAVRKLEEG